MQTYKQAVAAYLKPETNTEVLLAESTGLSQATINRYRNGERFPDAKTARLIDEKTGGQIPFGIWQSDFLTRSGIAA